MSCPWSFEPNKTEIQNEGIIKYLPRWITPIENDRDIENNVLWHN